MQPGSIDFSQVVSTIEVAAPDNRYYLRASAHSLALLNFFKICDTFRLRISERKKINSSPDQFRKTNENIKLAKFCLLELVFCVFEK